MTSNMESLLRDSLHAEARLVAGQPEPYQTFVHLERRHRRGRYLTATAAVAVLAAAGIVAVPVLAPGAADAGGPARLAEGPPRGPLAADSGWLSGFRSALPEHGNEPDWKLVADEVDVVWAGEVPGARIVVADVPYRKNGVTDWHLSAFTGAPGAAPDRMDELGDIGVSETGLVGTIAGGSDTAPGYALVIGPAGSTVTMRSGLEYGADGRLHATGTQVGEPGDGIAITRLEPAPGNSLRAMVLATVTAGGRTLFDNVVGAGWSSDENSPISRAEPQYLDLYRGVTDDMLRTALGGHSFDLTVLRNMVGSALNHAGLVADQVAMTVPWTGTIEGQPAIMWHLRVRDGGVLTYLSHGTEGRLDGYLLQPAAGFAERPIGWRLHAEGTDRRGDRVAVVAPGASTATVTVTGRAPETVTLDSSGFAMTTVPDDAEASVTTTGPDGDRTTTKIRPFEQIMAVPGTTPGTRLID
ncbi:hypothetical protein [Actinoplanes sp. G11-F43]|uniref:hypothetical protein n=1 Tax=Actinoplanes sp. G11-F43 TaxID=3424130 RepID=UPI003D33E79F